MNEETRNLRLWRGHKVELLFPSFKNDGNETVALVKALGRIKLLEPTPRVIGPGRSFLVPLSDLTEVKV